MVVPKSLAAAQTTVAEKASLKIVHDMVATWDIARLSPFFAVDRAFRLRPTDVAATRGLEVVEEAIQRGSASGQKIQHELLESFARGPVVAIEKLNQFITPEKTRTSHVVAIFLLKDGKIAEWTEYFIEAA